MRSKTSANSWLICQPQASTRIRLFCFSYAGGNAVNYIPWQNTLDTSIEICAVQLPGRGSRLMEIPYTEFTPLIEKLAQVLFDQNNALLPFSFFGHSLGGLIAFELTKYCMRHLLPIPRHLFVSSCAAPQHRKPSQNLYKLSDSALIETLRSYNGTPPEILENRELMALVLPAIRADFSLAENYQYTPDQLLEIPITVLAGKRDNRILPEQVDGWKKETIHSCHAHWFDGDHFFINSQQQAVINCINSVLLNSLS